MRQFYAASGGVAWRSAAECDSVGRIIYEGKSGSIRSWENLRNGASISRVVIPALAYKEVSGDDSTSSWTQDASGYIQISHSDDPKQVDSRYLSSRAYWRPHFGGATVHLLSPEAKGKTVWDRVQLKVPGGAEIVLWINRETRLLDRVQGPGVTARLSQYRRVDGVMLPFLEKDPEPNGEITIRYAKRTIRAQVNRRAFWIPFPNNYRMPASGKVTVPTTDGTAFKVVINGQGPFKALFDTGAVDVISKRVAKQLGLSAGGAEVGMHTVTQAMFKVRTVIVKTIKIGNLTVHDQKFYVGNVPAGAPQILIGYQMLRLFIVKIDWVHHSLTFYNAPHFHYSGSGTAVPMHFKANLIMIKGSIGDTSGSFQLDTGNQFGSKIYGYFAHRHHLDSILHAKYIGYDGRGEAGPSRRAYIVRIKNFRMGAVRVPSVIFHIGTGVSNYYYSGMDGNLGRSVLDRFNEVFDCVRGVVYLERNKNSDKAGIFNGAGLILDSFGHGIEIMTVLPGSPGAEAKLRAGDIIKAINGKVPTDESATRVFHESNGTVLHLLILRDGKLRHAAVTLQHVL